MISLAGNDTAVTVPCFFMIQNFPLLEIRSTLGNQNANLLVL
jgi:hypothetical protein